MYFKKIIKTAIALAISSTLLASYCYASPYEIMPSINEKYEYLQDLSDAEWQDMNHIEMIEACRIKDIETFNTSQLVQAFTDFPILVDLLAFDNYRVGFEVLLAESDALRYGVKNKDFINGLIQYYEEIPPISRWNEGSTSFMAQMWYIEIVLAQPEVIEALNETEVKRLIQIMIDKRTDKLIHPDLYNATIDLFFETLDLNGYSYLYSAMLYAANTQVTITTQDGASVTAYIRSPDYTSSEANAVDNEYLSAYSSVTKLRTSTKKYNCHSYAYVDQSANNIYWIEDNHAFACWNGIYTNTNTPSTGRKAYYGTPLPGSGTSSMHSGIVNSVSASAGAFIVSKWANGPLVAHRYDKCPYYQSNTTLLYKRK